jgi:hypothetical protein
VPAGSGLISQRHGFEDPYPYNNATDPQHWWWQYRYPYLVCNLLGSVKMNVANLIPGRSNYVAHTT